MKLQLNAFKAVRVLFFFVLFLLLNNCLGIYLRFNGYAEVCENYIDLFDFNFERNLPTYYSALVILLNGILLLIIAFHTRQKKLKFKPWLGLGVVFVFLSLDEMLSIHEQLWMPTQQLLNTTGFFYFAWYIPYGILLLILLLMYIKFLLNLPKRTLQMFVLAGLVFVLGAIGFEAISGKVSELHGQGNLLYSLWYSIEELFEMIGMLIFLYALLDYMASTIEVLHIDIESKKSQSH